LGRCRPARATRHVRNRPKHIAQVGHHHIRYPHTVCSTKTWCPIRRHLGDTHGVTLGDTHGDSVSPTCIPQLGCKLQCKYNTLVHRAGTRINPDLPLGAPPLGLPISPSVPDSIFRRFIVPSQIATHHHGFQPDGCCRFIGVLLRWRRFILAGHFLWLCLGKQSKAEHDPRFAVS
jgi:hypothetical protein